MVNKTIVSRFTGELPLDTGKSRKIADGPLYPVSEVLELLENMDDQVLSIWTNKCQRDIQKWALDMDDVCELIKTAVRTGRFRGAEWCVSGSKGPWAACDAYSLLHQKWVENAHRDMAMEYYVKFAIAKTGQLLLVVSCHPSEDRR